jgi:hypothetical protein
MFITMGTSLFHSATWEPEGPLAQLPEYREWTQGDLLVSPDKRLSCANSAKIRDGLKTLLEARDVDQWWSCLPQDLRDGEPLPATLRRYSAELTTILKLANEETQGKGKLKDFLSSYEEIRLAHDPNSPPDGGKNLPLIAATHLARYLNGIPDSQTKAVLTKIPSLSSTDPTELLESNVGLRKLGQEICAALMTWDQVDIIISGGYKIYGIFLAPAIERVQGKIARLIYIHEEGDFLMRITRHSEELDPQAYRPEDTTAQFELSLENIGHW